MKAEIEGRFERKGPEPIRVEGYSGALEGNTKRTKQRMQLEKNSEHCHK